MSVAEESPDESADPGVTLFREPDDEDAPPTHPGVARRPLRILSVAGAKGGAGKSVLASNLAVYLASIGRQVILADADEDGANLHTMVGVQRPPMPRELPDPRVDDEDEDHAGPILIDTHVPGLRVHHAGLDEAATGEKRRTRRARLAERLRALDADYVVVDLGAGLSTTLLDFHLAADLAVFVTLPEPTATENTYRFLRHAFLRFLRHGVPDEPRRALLQRARDLGGAPAPMDLWRSFEEEGDPLADVVREWMERFAPALVLNQTRLRADLELGEHMRSAARRRLGISVEYLGHIDYDDTVWNCVRNRRLLLVESPGSKSAKAVEKIARRLLALEVGKGGRRRDRAVPPESHHDLLEVERGATDEEVRRAFKRMRDVYAPGSLPCYGLFEPEELEKVRTRVEEAFDVLLDPARRRPYELSVFPGDDDEEEEDEPAVARPLSELPPPPAITPETDFSGALIRQVRESQGVELRAISQRTKVGLDYLVAIEIEDYSALPAPVYVRGFVTEFAKYLRLDSAQVSRTYVKRYRRFIEERGQT